jgi:hypothetical protein
MRAAHAVEPALSWPSDIRRPVQLRLVDGEGAWSSRSVAAELEPLARVAALLVSISQNNRYEGRDPNLMPDAFSSGFVADLLGMDIDELATQLIELNRRGLVEACGSALRLKDLTALESLAN